MMNDDNEKQEEDLRPQGECACGGFRKAAGIVCNLIVKLGISSRWGSLIASLLVAGAAVFASLSASGCAGAGNWSIEGERGSISLRRDAESGMIVIEGKRHSTVDEVK